MEYKDYYKIMGVQHDASQDEIKRAYRKLARRYHPDVSKQADAEEKFKELGEAYEVLKDPQKRQAYDQLGQRWQHGQEFRPPPDWEPGFDFSGGFSSTNGSRFSDFFESLFGRMQPGYTTSRAGFRARGEDLHTRLNISLEESYHGTTRTVSLVIPEAYDEHGHSRQTTQTLQVRIPKGVTRDQRIRLSGKGAPGIGKQAPAGDLYLQIDFEPHPLFQVKGRDIFLNLPVTPWEAALGAEISVPTLGGNVEMKLPPGSQTGKKLRLKGRGLPGEPPGDQFVVLQIETPPADSDAARTAYRNFAEAVPFKPRARLETN